MLEPVLLTDEPIDGAALLASVGSADAGANVLFLGTTRSRTRLAATGRENLTAGLEYEAHAMLALAELARLQEEATRRFELEGCRIVHRLGAVVVGEASVAVAVAAAHRREAFEAAAWLMDEVKRRVPIWKCEIGPDGGRDWVHPADAPGGAAP